MSAPQSSPVAVAVSVVPAKLLVDDTPVITVTSLPPACNVTLVAVLKEGAEEVKQQFLSFAHYTADHHGVVTNTYSRSVGGRFTGVDPNGLFWSMKAVGDDRYSERLRIKDVTLPLRVHIYVLHGHRVVSEPPMIADVMCSCMVERTYLADHVMRIPVRVGRLRATMFIPNNGSGRHPGVMDIFGTVGGLTEYRAALLASRGFTTMALAFFGYEDLPPTLSPVDLTYFEEAIDFLSSHKSVLPGGVGVTGVSKGADLAMFTSIISPKVNAAVSIAGFHANLHTQIHYKDKEYACTMMDFDKIIYGPNNEEIYREAFLKAEGLEDYLIPIEKSVNCHYMFLHGTADAMNDCTASLRLAQRLRAAGRDDFELHIYEQAGHLIEPPYSPLCRTSYHKIFGTEMCFGGDVVGHARAQQDHWPRLLQFLARHLPTPPLSESLLSLPSNSAAPQCSSKL